MRFNRIKKYIIALGITALLVTLLSVTSFGRFLTTVEKDIGFNVKPLSTINLLDSDKSSVTGNEIQWDLSEEKDFYITPYYGDTSQITMTEDTSVNVWIFIPDADDTSSGLGNLVFTFQPGTEETTYYAKGEFISANTPLYKEKGAGWLYRFYDSSDTEVVITIYGNEPTEMNVKLRLLNDNVDKTATISVQYTGKQEGADSE